MRNRLWKISICSITEAANENFFMRMQKNDVISDFWIIFVCLFAINGYVQIDRINDRYYTPESYRSFFSETKDMSLEEIQDYTNEMLERQNNGEYIEFPMMLVYDMSEHLKGM